MEVNNHYYLVFDVGGVFIRGGVLNHKGQLIENSLTYYPAKSEASTEEILDNLVNIISKQITNIIDKFYEIDGIGFAFPGPFDYENGISWISGVEKFDSLYGINLRTELMKRLKEKPPFIKKVSSQIKLLFENNVSMFALGEWKKQKLKGFNKMMSLTIGKGAGSAFLENGNIIKNRSDVPPNGWIYNTPFRDSIVDDYISTRGILQIARKHNLNKNLDLDELANLALLGDEEVREVFYEFGTYLGEMLEPFIKTFQPDAIIIGGQIANSFELYKKEVYKTITDENVNIILSDGTTSSTFIGLSSLFITSKTIQ